jgi:hypothetical protein
MGIMIAIKTKTLLLLLRLTGRWRDNREGDERRKEGKP